jgi:ParB family chromosome partitioning protein
MSNIKKRGLGRGLSALFGDADPTQENNKPTKVNSQKTVLIGDISRNTYQPRIKFDEEKLEELAKSIKNNGLIQPITVRADLDHPGKFEIVAGERRWLAAQRAGLHEIPINILELTNSEVLEVAIVENIQREDLNSIEEARGYDRLRKEFNYDQDKIASLMSKSRSHIKNTLRLLTLPDDIIGLLEQGILTAGQARPLIGLSNASEIAEAIINRKLSARTVEALAKEKKNFIKNKSPIDSNIETVINNLEDLLGLHVDIKNKKNNSGKIIIEYKNLDQFELITNLLKKH